MWKYTFDLKNIYFFLKLITQVSLVVVKIKIEFYDKNVFNYISSYGRISIIINLKLTSFITMMRKRQRFK